MARMACDTFTKWVQDYGLSRAAQEITEYEEARGKRGVSYQAIQDWLSKDIPPARVLCVEAISGIPRHVLRPDIYPPEDHDRKKWSGVPAAVGEA